MVCAVCVCCVCCVCVLCVCVHARICVCTCVCTNTHTHAHTTHYTLHTTHYTNTHTHTLFTIQYVRRPNAKGYKLINRQQTNKQTCSFLYCRCASSRPLASRSFWDSSSIKSASSFFMALVADDRCFRSSSNCASKSLTYTMT